MGGVVGEGGLVGLWWGLLVSWIIFGWRVGLVGGEGRNDGFCHFASIRTQVVAN